MCSIRNIIDIAINKYGSECEQLLWIPENRYNNEIFLNYGEYDWFSGQVLYCLIRYMKPNKIVEVSTGSGYATMYMNMALEKNEKGVIDTYEIEPELYESANKIFKKYGVNEFVRSYLGDAQKLIDRKAMDYDIYFLDSLHAEHFTRWFIETLVLNNTNDNALVHIHDVMPQNARVRCWNAPPIKGTNLDHSPSLSLKIKDFAKKILGLPVPERSEYIKINVRPPIHPHILPTFNGNQTTESVFVNKIIKKVNESDYCYLHDITNFFLNLDPRKFDRFCIGRQDENGKPYEWNEALWTKVKAIKAAYHML